MTEEELRALSRKLREDVKSHLKATPVEVVLRNPEIQFGWCRWHLADVGFVLRFTRDKRLVVWRMRQPHATRVYFDSLEELIVLVAERRFEQLVNAPPKALRITDEALA